jgi:RNA polymerase sigma-70 factor (ECF subfamily)
MALAAAQKLTLDESGSRRDETGYAFEVGPVRLVSDDLYASTLMAEAPVVLAVLRTICATEADAEDVLGATFEIALRHQADLREARLLRAWMLRIAIREALRLRRRLQRVVGLGWAEHERPDPSIHQLDERLVVREALNRLAPRTRLAVVLRYMVGLPVAEVAATLSTSQNTVKTQLRVGLAQLRKELEG